MPTDTQIFSGSDVAAPKDYVLPGNSEILLKAVHATFTDNGAAGDWLPAVVLISDSGHKIAQAIDRGVVVTAGNDAEVSWFPRVRQAGSSGPTPASTGLPIAAMYNNPGAGTTITHGGLTHYVSIQDGVSAAGFSTTDATVFTNGNTSLFTGSPVYGIQINKAGTYQVQNNAFCWQMGTAGRSVTTYWSASNGSAPSFLQQGRGGGLTGDTWDTNQAGLGPHNFLTEYITVSSAQTPAVLCVYGQVGGAIDVNVSFMMTVTQVSTLVLVKM